jgi:hypothetical protein
MLNQRARAQTGAGLGVDYYSCLSFGYPSQPGTTDVVIVKFPGTSDRQ